VGALRQGGQQAPPAVRQGAVRQGGYGEGTPRIPLE
jgi:hypothetical protein